MDWHVTEGTFLLAWLRLCSPDHGMLQMPRMEGQPVPCTTDREELGADS